MLRTMLTTMLAALILGSAPALATDPCELTWSIDDYGRLWMHHDMEANCGIAEFTHGVTFGESTIAVQEDGLCPWGLAVCLCIYDTDVVVSGLAPGVYTVNWRWCEVDMSGEIPEAYCVDCVFTVTVPAPAVVDPRLVGTQAAGCGIETVSEVPDDPGYGSATWGTIKALYR